MIEFRKHELGWTEHLSDELSVSIFPDNSKVIITGVVNVDQLEQIISKMKELQNEIQS